MEKVRITQKMKIRSVLPDGFEINLPEDKKLIPNTYFLRDTVFKNNETFKKGDIITITVENVEEIENDFIGEQITIYVIVNHVCFAGFYTKEYDRHKSKWEREWFHTGRGIITLPTLKKGDIYEVGDILKIKIEK